MVYVVMILLFFGVVVLIGNKVMDGVDGVIQDSGVVDSSGKSASTKLLGHYTGVIDNTFLFFTVALGIVTLALALMVRIHPIFIPFYFIGLVVVIFFSGIASNIYQEMASNAQISTIASNLTFISNILNTLPMIVGVFGILLMVAMYKMWSVQQ